MKSAIVIGSGFSGLSAAAFLAKEGVQVTAIAPVIQEDLSSNEE